MYLITDARRLTGLLLARSAANHSKRPRTPAIDRGMSEDRLFRAWRIRFYSCGVLASYLLFALIGCCSGTLGKTLGCVDFHWIWLSGRFAITGRSARIFDPALFLPAQGALVGAGCTLYPFAYPPTFLFFTAPLGRLSYPGALAAWDLATLALYLAAVSAILPRRTALIAAMTPFWVLASLAFGHNGLLTAGLMGLVLVSIERRPWLAALCLGLLSYKPQFGILFPLALVASRNWRLLAGSAVAGIVFGLAAAFAFGWQGWPAFTSALLSRHSIADPSGQAALIIETPFGLLHMLGAHGALAWAVQLAVAAVAAAAVWLVWRGSRPFNLKAAALCAGALLATPYALIYDLPILTIGAAFLVKDGLDRGFLRGERTTLLICWAVAFIAPLPSGSIFALALLFLATRRVYAAADDKAIDEALAAVTP
jgi:Glycosyltransferase family 87